MIGEVFDVSFDEFDGIELRIEMLGGFVIVCNGNRITEQIKRSSKVWKLIQYLVVHRHKTVSQEELSDAFCSDEHAGNPGSTVRTMVYRARTVLAECGIPGAEHMILSGNGGYRWNSSADCEVDIEEFDDLQKKISSATTHEERFELLMQATGIYHGDFLPNSSDEMWVMPLQRWYRTAFLNNVHEALDILADEGRSAEAEELSVKALRTDPFDEMILEHHLRALLSQGKSMEALDEYRKMETLLYDVLGVTFSDSLRSLYLEIQRPDTNEKMPLDDVLGDWIVGVDFPGAFYCDISVFKAVYQIEARSMVRSGRTTYVVRFETKYKPGDKDGGIMKELGRVIPLCLRKGDLFTRANPSQYMLMLNSLTYENCSMLVSRILGTLDSKFLSKVTGTSIRPVRPIL